MLKLINRKAAWPAPTIVPGSGSLASRDDLRIRNLLDDPRLRRSMGLDELPTLVPEPRFDRRRLLQETAA